MFEGQLFIGPAFNVWDERYIIQYTHHGGSVCYCMASGRTEVSILKREWSMREEKS